MPADKAPSPPTRKRSLVLTFGTNVGIMGLTVATGTLNARLLGPTGRGELAAIQTIPSVLGMIILLGLPSAVGYYTARRPAEARPFVLSALTICLVAAVPAIVAGYFLLPWALRNQSVSVIRDARVYLAFVALQGLHFPYMALQGLGKFAVWNLLRFAPNVAAFAAIMGSWAMGTPNSGTLSRWYLVMFALVVPLTYGTLWAHTTPGGRPRVHQAKELFRYGLPSALMVPAGLLNLQLDQMVMAAWLPSQMLGLYAVSVSWSGLISPAFGALGSMIFPALASAKDETEQHVLVGRSLRLAVLAVIGLGIGLAAITPFVFPLFFGKAFASAVPTALLLVAAGMVLNVGNVCSEVLRGLGAPRWPLYGQLVALPATAALLVVLLPRWGIFGAAVVSVVTYSMAAAVCVGGIRKICRLPLRELLVPKRQDCAEVWSAMSSTFRRKSW